MRIPEIKNGHEIHLEENLTNQVERAFLCRPQVDLTPDGKATVALIEENRRLYQRLKYLPDSYIVMVNRPQLLPHEIEVDNIEDFEALILLAAAKVAQHNHYPDSWAVQASNKLFEHEKEHVNALDNRTDIPVGYKVKFLTDDKTGKAAFLPIVFVYGKVEVGLIRNFFKAPNERSTTDKAFGKRRKAIRDY